MLKRINRKQRWTQHHWIRLVAGSMILLSLLLALTNQNWLFLTAFVGLNLLQSAFTNWCPLIVLLQKLRVPEQ
ncbi:Inner membrane protein YgaP-like transmembrane domain-containing protein [Tumidithrix helvetica PCC 7403]|uniref:YgaP family membrane protein n=1 Tax=Tumidithrix helvetica TaxID=3457545 RepID=UPI003C8297B1